MVDTEVINPVEARYTEPEFMKMMNLKSRLTPYRWRKRGWLGYYKIGLNIYYGESHIKEFLARCERKARRVRA